MVKLIKRGGFREKTSRQSRYKDSVNHQTAVPEQPAYQPDEPSKPVSGQQPVTPAPDDKAQDNKDK